MPAKRSERIVNLLERYQFAGTVLFAEAKRWHDAQVCCMHGSCTMMRSLAASMDKLSNEAQDITDELTDTRKPRRRTTTPRPETNRPSERSYPKVRGTELLYGLGTDTHP